MGIIQSESINGGASVAKSLTNIGTTPVEVCFNGTKLNGRRGVYLKNTSVVVLYWGFSSTAANVVFPLAAESVAGKGDGGDIWIDVGDAQAIYIKAASGSTNTAAIGELK